MLTASSGYSVERLQAINCKYDCDESMQNNDKTSVGWIPLSGFHSQSSSSSQFSQGVPITLKNGSKYLVSNFYPIQWTSLKNGAARCQLTESKTFSQCILYMRAIVMALKQELKHISKFIWKQKFENNFVQWIHIFNNVLMGSVLSFYQCKNHEIKPDFYTLDL